MIQQTERFYEELKGFSRFDDVCDPLRYHDVPADWHVLVADVAGSTKAIESGRYKDVNALGVSCIVAVVNACRGVDLPFVFGGDGATILVPPSRVDDARCALLGVADLAARQFDIELRVGVVPIRALRARGHRVAVARLSLSSDVSLAMLSGDGVTVADEWVKAPGSPYVYATSENYFASLEGFECRWEPLRSANGQVVSLLVLARDHRVYRSLLGRLEELGGEERLRPSSRRNLRIASRADAFAVEARLRTRVGGVFRRWVYALHTLLITSIGRFLLAIRKNFGGFNGQSYLEQTALQTDFRKFDGVLRMILDLDDTQLQLLKQELERAHEEGELCYGIHVSDHALMTCFVQDYMGRHVHFVDGGDGGYAIAARQLKAQLERRRNEVGASKAAQV